VGYLGEESFSRTFEGCPLAVRPFPTALENRLLDIPLVSERLQGHNVVALDVRAMTRVTSPQKGLPFLGVDFPMKYKGSEFPLKGQ